MPGKGRPPAKTNKPLLPPETVAANAVVAELEVGSGIEGPFQDAFEASLDPGEAALLRARAEGLVVLRRVLGAWKGTQAEKAQRLGIRQPSFNKVMKGDARRISLDYIIKLSGRAGVESKVSYHPPASVPATREKADRGLSSIGG